MKNILDFLFSLQSDLKTILFLSPIVMKIKNLIYFSYPVN